MKTLFEILLTCKACQIIEARDDRPYRMNDFVLYANYAYMNMYERADGTSWFSRFDE